MAPQQAIQSELQSRAGADAKWDALLKLEALSEELAADQARNTANKFLNRAIKAWRNADYPKAGQMAMKAIAADEDYSKPYHVLAMALEKMGFLHKALVSYQRAVELDPDNCEILVDLGMTAWNMGMTDMACEFFERFIKLRPDSPLGFNNLGVILGQMDKSDEAVEVLRGAIYRAPEEPLLWNSLGSVLAEDGRVEESLVFYKEALRLDPNFIRVYHNLGFCYIHMGLMSEALECYEKALASKNYQGDRLEYLHSRSLCLLGMGKLDPGFTEYELRTNERFRASVPHMLKAPLWKGEPLEGKRLLVVSEQGLGDELMLASTIPDLYDAVGPTGKLQIAVDRRLIPLFQRSFPNAEIGIKKDVTIANKDGHKTLRTVPFATENGEPDYYILMGSTYQYLRKSIDDFPKKTFIKADPERVKYYRELLAAGGDTPTVGICWRSMALESKRSKYYSNLDQWRPIFKTPGVRFVNVQYGDCMAELNGAIEKHGVPVQVIEGLDLKNDIEGAAALSAALDLVISVATASAQIAAAVGTETWFIGPGRSWAQLGTDEMPWYEKTRAITAKKFRDWDELMPRVADELAAFARR